MNPADLHQLFQPAILFLELFHLPGLIRLHTNILFLPSIEGLFADPHLANHLHNRHSQLRLLQHSPICSTENRFFFMQNLPSDFAED
jgi:hypothetical protein